MLHGPKDQPHVAALFGGEGVLPLAAAGVYPKTRVWGSKPKNVHCSSATSPLKVELRWGCEESSGKTAVGSGVSFKYDPLGRRIYKSSSSGTSVYAYDGNNLVEETNSSGSVVARYSQGLSIDEPLAMLRSSATSFYNADGLGSITSLANAAGSLAQTYTFDSFGRQTASSGSLVNPFQYTGRESDTETGLYYYRARYYDENGGRFLNEDPASFLSGGINFYEYVENSPLGFTDPNGLQAQPAKPCCDDKKIKDGLRQLQQAFSGATADKSKIFQKYKPCLQKLAGDLKTECGPPPAGHPRTCGYHSDYSPSTVVITPKGSRGLGGCPGAMFTLAHEMVHSCYQNDLGSPTNLSNFDQEKEAYGITCQLWGIQCACARNPRLCEPGL
jgi:RHS repeat-associated protein